MKKKKSEKPKPEHLGRVFQNEFRNTFRKCSGMQYLKPEHFCNLFRYDHCKPEHFLKVFWKNDNKKIKPEHFLKVFRFG